MLAVLDKNKKELRAEEPKRQDIIVERIETEIIENEDGSETKIRKKKHVNVTKMINETKKLVKQSTAQDIIAKLDEIKGVYTK